MQLQFKNKEIDTAIFDMDGTMFDTERLRFRTLSQAAEELFGKPFTEEVLMGSLGLSATRAEELAKQHYGDGFPYADIRRRADELELQHVRTHGVPIKPGLLPVLERLRRTGLKMAVATSSRRAIAEEYLINAGIYKYFDLCVCGDEVTQGKPHPEIFLKAAEALNSVPARCLMFEDSENGLRSAADAGGVAILVEDIKPPRPEVAGRAFARYASLRGFLQELSACTPRLPMPQLTEPFPQAVNQLKAGIHGFGAMGGGYLAQVFSHWDGYTRPAEIVASTGSRLLREAVEAFGQYSVRYGSLAFDQAIERMRMVDAADDAAVSGMYRDCEIVALCLPEQAIVSQAGVIAQGLLDRLHARGRELTVLTVLNKVGGAAFVRGHVERALAQQASPADARRVLERTHFCETVVTRIVSRLTDEAVMRQLRIKHDLYETRVAARREAVTTLDGDDEPFEPIDPVVGALREAGEPASAMAQLHLVLFNSETDMPIYAQRGGELLEHLRQIDTVDDIGEIQALKNRLWNGTHAIVAWYAALLGFPTIGHAMGDERVQRLMDHLLDVELAPALGAEYPALRSRLPGFVSTFRRRCAHAFKDPCARVGRDPLRKLQRHERVLGSLSMARRHGLPVQGLALGAALAVHYALHHADAADDGESQTIRRIYAERQCLADVLAWNGEYYGQPFAGLDAALDAGIVQAVQAHFDRLQSRAAAYLDAPALS
ncbi:MAG: HAD-IA family hydrolase [Burkholderiaceae bacterium]|nr:HAD-IA family hydrolase [Burkholderiaceae bacterium]